MDVAIDVSEWTVEQLQSPAFFEQFRFGSGCTAPTGRRNPLVSIVSQSSPGFPRGGVVKRSSLARSKSCMATRKPPQRSVETMTDVACQTSDLQECSAARVVCSSPSAEQAQSMTDQPFSSFQGSSKFFRSASDIIHKMSQVSVSTGHSNQQPPVDAERAPQLPTPSKHANEVPKAATEVGEHGNTDTVANASSSRVDARPERLRPDTAASQCTCVVDGDVMRVIDNVLTLGSSHVKQWAKLPAEVEYMVFDTETSGRGPKSFVVQLAIAFFDKDHRALAIYNRIWRLPKGGFIEKGAQEIHKITPERCFHEGVYASDEMPLINEWFKQAIQRNIALVAFNSAFDVRMLKATAQRHGVAEWILDEKHTTCTFKLSRAHSGLRDIRGHRRGFKNEELYFHFYKRKPNGRLHDAATDVLVSACCYAMGERRRWW